MCNTNSPTPDWRVDVDPEQGDDYTGDPDRSPDPDGWPDDETNDDEAE